MSSAGSVHRSGGVAGNQWSDGSRGTNVASGVCGSGGRVRALHKRVSGGQKGMHSRRSCSLRSHVFSLHGLDDRTGIHPLGIGVVPVEVVVVALQVAIGVRCRRCRCDCA